MQALRCYTFINFYLSSIQQGIQSGHVIGDMFAKYRYSAQMSDRVYEWAEKHKTLITLNGGANEDIDNIFASLVDISAQLDWTMPVTDFHEDEMSLGGIRTGCGIIIPESIFDAVNFNKATFMYPDLNPGAHDAKSYVYIQDSVVQAVYEVGTLEWRLVDLVKSCPLAR